MYIKMKQTGTTEATLVMEDITAIRIYTLKYLEIRGQFLSLHFHISHTRITDTPVLKLPKNTGHICIPTEVYIYLPILYKYGAL